jgi:hypothetical protein
MSEAANIVLMMRMHFALPPTRFRDDERSGVCTVPYSCDLRSVQIIGVTNEEILRCRGSKMFLSCVCAKRMNGLAMGRGPRLAQYSYVTGAYREIEAIGSSFVLAWHPQDPTEQSPFFKLGL